MVVDPLLGWIPQHSRWAPSIRYLLRRLRIMQLLGPLPRGRYLEIGCGAGTLLAELGSSGFDVTGMETSIDAFQVAEDTLRESGQSAALVRAPSSDWQGKFDIVAAFDVLEHVEDDRAALVEWASWLASGGTMVITVPAHESRWGDGDVWAGHYRRYSKGGVVNLVESIGLRVDHVECYGFPVANMTEFLGNFYYRRAIRQREAARLDSRDSGNALSGVDRNSYKRVTPLLTSLPGRLLLRAANLAQRATLRTDWGSGYLLSASKV